MNRMQIWLAALQGQYTICLMLQLRQTLSMFDTADSIFGLNDELDIPSKFSTLIFYNISYKCISSWRTMTASSQPVLMRISKSSVIVCKHQVLSFKIHLRAIAFVWSIKAVTCLSGTSQIALPLSHSTFHLTVTHISIFPWV